MSQNRVFRIVSGERYLAMEIIREPYHPWELWIHVDVQNVCIVGHASLECIIGRKEIENLFITSCIFFFLLFCNIIAVHLVHLNPDFYIIRRSSLLFFLSHTVAFWFCFACTPSMTNLFIFKHTSLRNYRVKPNLNHEKPAMEKRGRISKQLKVRLIIHRAGISSHNRLWGQGEANHSIRTSF